MGIACSKQKDKQPSKNQEIKKQQDSPKSLTTSKEALNYIESVQLSNMMRTKPIKTYIAEQIAQQQIYVDSCEVLAEKIESKSQLILRSYNHYTEKALKIKLKVLEYYKNEYLNYINSNVDSIENKQLIQKETIQLLVETTVILNCLMDKNFDDETELWWGSDYFQDRIQYLTLSAETSESTDNITMPLLLFISALKQRILRVMPLLTANPKSIANSVAITNVHLTQFYKDLKLEFAKNVEEEEIH